jgi:hypothetical protein
MCPSGRGLLGSYVLSGRGLLGSYVLSGRGLVLASNEPFWKGVFGSYVPFC